MVDNLLNTQKSVVDTVLENTKKLASGNTLVSETMEKGSEWYKNWLDSQKSFFGKTTEKMTEATESIKESTDKAKETYQSMMDRQSNMMRQMYDMNMNFMKSATPAQPTASSNPMDAFTNMWSSAMGNMQNAFQSGNTFSNWMKPMQDMNPFSAMSNMGNWNMTSGSNPFSNIFTQWNELMTQQMRNMQGGFKSGGVQDAYRNMMSTADGYARFYQLWTPMWKSIQDKTFNMDVFRKMVNPTQYKEMMDQYFGFMPENVRGYMQQSSGMMQEMMKQWTSTGSTSMEQMRGMMGNMMPGSSEMFSTMLNNYNGLYNQMQSAMAPMARMSTPNKYTKNMAEWSDISNRMVQYSIKNAELQYLVYEQGQKVMEEMAHMLTQKVQTGEEITSMMAMYQDWMRISDKTFVKLFESESYSALMAEVGSMQMRLKKDMELQMEGALSTLPVATRSELDELYKTIYDLKKQVRQMEKMMEVEGDNDNVADATATASTTAKKTTTATNGTNNNAPRKA